MGQVPHLENLISSIEEKPPKFLLIGSGRLALHLKSYLKALNLDVVCWSRDDSELFNTLPVEYPASWRFIESANACTHILLAISDKAIAPFFEEHKNFEDKTWVHFSGTFWHPNVLACHPLMTFGQQLYELDVYKKIPFILDRGAPAFESLLPGLPNPSYRLSPEKRILYHAYCVMSGNFTHLLWWMTEQAFEKDLGLPAEVLRPYKMKVFEGAIADSKLALTGPLVRNDEATIERHLSELDPRKAKIYEQFVLLFRELVSETSHHLTPDSQPTSPQAGGPDEHP